MLWMIIKSIMIASCHWQWWCLDENLDTENPLICRIEGIPGLTPVNIDWKINIDRIINHYRCRHHRTWVPPWWSCQASPRAASPPRSPWTRRAAGRAGLLASSPEQHHGQGDCHDDHDGHVWYGFKVDLISTFLYFLFFQWVWSTVFDLAML